MLNNKLFQAMVWILVFFILIWVGQHISFIFEPVVVLVTTIFFPVLVAGVLFYLTDPVVAWLSRHKIPRKMGIFLMFLIFGALIFSIVLFIVPNLQLQLISLINRFPAFLDEITQKILEFERTPFFQYLDQFDFFQEWQDIDYNALIDNVVQRVVSNIGDLLGYFANLAVVMFTVPFLLFYMLKDGHQIPRQVASYFPKSYGVQVERIIKDMSSTISSYIQGVLIVSVFVGALVYIGYLIIGLDYALLLGFVAMVTNVIPYFGPIIGTIPGVVVGLIDSPITALKVAIMIAVVQQLESQLVSPQVIGRKLKIHPVTIIVVLLTAGSLGGVLAVILAVPTFAVARVVITHIYALIKTRNEIVG